MVFPLIKMELFCYIIHYSELNSQDYNLFLFLWFRIIIFYKNMPIDKLPGIELRKIEMTTVKEIEQAVTKLPKRELKHFTSWFEEFDSKNWDEQFEMDVKEGKLDKLAEKALKEFEKGKCQEL